tara:strand:- start:250 stop:471 length:222 start_codon:yes stop_codon:yes gene_type:complete
MVKKNDKYALHAKRRLQENGENFTLSPYSDNEVENVKDRFRHFEKLRKSNDPEHKKILSVFLNIYQKKQKFVV